MLYRVGKAGPLFPHSQKIQATTYYRGTISGITILYKRDVVNVGAKLAQIERKRNAGSRLIEVEGRAVRRIEIRPRHGFPFFAGGSTVIINAERNLHLARGDRRGNWRY